MNCLPSDVSHFLDAERCFELRALEALQFLVQALHAKSAHAGECSRPQLLPPTGGEASGDARELTSSSSAQGVSDRWLGDVPWVIHA
jgi:hypothetical protein